MNRKWVVASRPEVEVQAGNFELKQEPVPAVPPGAVLVKTRYLVVSPPARMALVSGGIAGRPIPIGATMRGSGFGEVVESRHADFAAGDLVTGELGWQQYAVSDGQGAVRCARCKAALDWRTAPCLHVMGSGGATAYFGMDGLLPAAPRRHLGGVRRRRQRRHARLPAWPPAGLPGGWASPAAVGSAIG